MTRPFFVRDRITDFDLFDRHTNNAISKMKERFAEGEPVDFQVRWFLVVLLLVDQTSYLYVQKRMWFLGLIVIYPLLAVINYILVIDSPWIRRQNSFLDRACTVCRHRFPMHGIQSKPNLARISILVTYLPKLSMMPNSSVLAARGWWIFGIYLSSSGIRRGHPCLLFTSTLTRS